MVKNAVAGMILMMLFTFWISKHQPVLPSWIILTHLQPHSMRKNFNRSSAAASPRGWRKCIPQYGDTMASGFLNYLIYVDLIYGKNIGNS